MVFTIEPQLKNEKIHTLTTGEAAQYCGVNFRTVIRWIQRGYLKAFQLPGRGDNRIDVNDLLDFLRKHQMPIPKEFQNEQPLALIVDDDAEMVTLLRRSLTKAGFRTLTASDGLEAGTLLSENTPDLITLDLHMKELDGEKVIRLVRENPRLNAVHILVISGMSKAELDRSLKLGANDVLAKPFQPKQLLEKVSPFLGSVSS